MPYKDPDQAREYRKQWRQSQRIAEGTARISLVSAVVRMTTAGDVLALLAEQVAAVRAEVLMTTGDRARTIGYLAGISLRAIEAGDIAARLEALEDALKARRVA